jgi:hypothetical protein
VVALGSRRLIGCDVRVLLTSLLELLCAVMISDQFLGVVEKFEDGESLFWGPVSRHGKGYCEE